MTFVALLAELLLLPPQEVLEAGSLHDFSVFPAWTPRYGMPAAPVGSHWVRAGDGRLVGSRMVLAYGDTVHDWFAESELEAKDLYPNDALVWAVLKAFAGGRWKRVDSGGAGRPDQPFGVREFKRKLGGEEVAFGTFRTVHRPLTYLALTGARNLVRRWTGAFPKAGRRNESAAAPMDDGNARAATKDQP